MRFIFSAVKKPIHNKEYQVILEEKVYGIIYVTNSWEYRVRTKTGDYTLHPKSFSCKGKTKVYFTTLDNRKQLCMFIRHDKHELLKYFFVPFKPGSIVIGKVLKNSNGVFFKIDKLTNEYCDDSKIVYQMFKDNYKEINIARIDQLIKYFET